MKKILTTFLLICFLASNVLAKGPVVVSSKIDAEGLLLGNLIKFALIENGFEIKDRIQLGATNILRQAIQSDQIDIYADYTGNGPFFFDIKEKSIFNNFQKGYETVKKLDAEKNRLIWLTPSPASNGWAIAGRKEFCDKHNIRSMEDFAKFVRKGNKIKLVASETFISRFDALPAFEKVYDFKLKKSQLVTLSSTNTSVALKALAQETDGINFSMTYSTDGSLAALGLYVLADTKTVQPIYAPCPIIRQEVLASYPEIENILAPVFSKLTLETLQELNAKIAVMGHPADEIAKNYLQSIKK